MKYAIISDIHANATALTLSLDHIRRENVDRIVCLGDIVGFHTEPGACIDLVRTHDVACIAGNHDDGVRGVLNRSFFPEECWEAIQWTRERLTGDQMKFLNSLPHHLVVDNRIRVMHGTWASSYRYLVGRARLTYTAFRLRHAGFPIAFHGHTHQTSCCRAFGRTLPWYMDSLDTSHPLFLSESVQYIINPGSVGQPRTGQPCASFALFDTKTNKVEWRRIRYDYHRVVAQTLSVFPSHRHLYQRFNTLPQETGVTSATRDPISGSVTTS